MSPELSTYREYQARINAREVLARYGARNCSEQTNTKDGTTEVVHSCLLDAVEPHHRNGDEHPSAWCNIDKNLYVCASYWSGDLVHLIQKLERKDTLAETLPIVGEMLSGATKGVVELQEAIQRIFDAGAVTEVQIPTYSPRALNQWLMTHPYMREERGITQHAQEYLHIGYDPRENRIVIPHFWHGELVGWQKRSIPARPGQWPGTENPHPKYRSSLGFPKSETLYMYDNYRFCSSGSVVVVESPMSCIKAFSLGVTSPPVVATFGAKVSATQIDLLAGAKEVIVWFDADAAGYVGSKKLVEGLIRRTQVMVVIPDPDQDLGDYTSSEAVYEKLETAMPAALWLGEVERMEAQA